VCRSCSRADALTSVASGNCDAAIIGIGALRATKVDYSPPIVEADYTILAPAGSPYRTIADADRIDVRIAAVRHHASTIALGKLIKHATFVYADMRRRGVRPRVLERPEAGAGMLDGIEDGPA
jgi:ABC-type amino acid transport substrate-binding protein